MRALIPIKDIADDVCELVGDSQRKYLRFVAKRIAVEYRDLCTYITTDVSLFTEIFDRDHVISMPSNFNYYTKVGVWRNGQIVFLSTNETIDDRPLPGVGLDQAGAFGYVVNGFKSSVPSGVHFYNLNGETIEAYGSGVKNNGYYRIDEKEGVLYLGSNFPTGCKVAVEYVGDPIIGGIKTVPSTMYKALYAKGAEEYYLKKRDPMYAEYQNQNRMERIKLDRLYNVLKIDVIKQIFNEVDRNTISPNLI